MKSQIRRRALSAATLAAILSSGAHALGAQPVIEPGSPDGPHAFAGPDSISGGTCQPNEAGIFDELDGDGNLIGQAGCLVPAAFPAPPPGTPDDRLQASAVSRLPVGPTLFRGTTFQDYDFTVSPSPSGRATAIPAMVTVEIDIKGILASVLEGRAGIEVVLEVFDITGGTEDPPRVGTKEIFEQETAGSFAVGLNLDAGVTLPAADGQVTVGASVGMEGEVAFVNEEESASLEVLLQRGRSYRLRVQLESRAGVGVGGGLALSSFFSPSSEELLSEIPDLRGLRSVLDSVADLIAVPELDTTFLSLDEAIDVPSFSIPGFTVPAGDSGLIDIPDVSTAALSHGYGNRWSGCCGIGLTVYGSSMSLDSFTVQAGSARLQTPSFAFDGITVPEQTFLPSGPMADLEELVDLVNLPAFDEGFSGAVLLDWMQPLLKEGRELSPLLDAILAGSGVRVESLTVTLEEDVSEMGSGITAEVGSSQVAVVGSVGSARAGVVAGLDSARTTLTTAIEDSRDELSELVETRSAGLDRQLGDWVSLNLRTKIENNLSATGRSPVATFMLPPAAPFYGLLEEVRQVVDETIERMLQAGQEVFNAEAELEDGDAAYAAGDYKEAYKRYRKAYRAAVK